MTNRRCPKRWTSFVLLVALAAVLLAPAGSLAATPAYFVIIVLDACRPDYLDLADFPNLRALMARGTSYQNAWSGQLVNNTPPAHATIGTGVFPKRHGIVSFHWRDAAAGKPSPMLDDLNNVINDQLGQLISDSGVPTLVGQYRSRNPAAKAVSLSSSKFFASSAMGNHTADSIVSGRYLDGLYGPLAINGHAPPVAFMSNPLLWKSGLLSSLEKERWVGDVALAFVKDATPQFLMVNIAGPDVAGHETGGIISPAAMIQSVKNADIQVGRIRAAYGQLGILDKTLFVVVADHGMIPNTHVIDSELVRTAAEANSTVIAVSAGNHLWLRHPAKAEAVAQAIVQGLGSRLLAVYYKVNTSGIYEYLPAKPASQPDAYAYLLDTYACANGPDVVMMAPENSVLGNVAEIANSKGSHTAITWDTQHVPLIIAGPGVRKGWVSSFPARLVDIAPTILAIAGIQPEGMDGVVLADSMVTPSPGAVNAMQTIEGRLRSAQEALISLSSGP